MTKTTLRIIGSVVGVAVVAGAATAAFLVKKKRAVKPTLSITEQIVAEASAAASDIPNGAEAAAA